MNFKNKALKYRHQRVEFREFYLLIYDLSEQNNGNLIRLQTHFFKENGKQVY